MTTFWVIVALALLLYLLPKSVLSSYSTTDYDSDFGLGGDDTGDSD